MPASKVSRDAPLAVPEPAGLGSPEVMAALDLGGVGDSGQVIGGEAQRVVWFAGRDPGVAARHEHPAGLIQPPPGCDGAAAGWRYGAQGPEAAQVAAEASSDLTFGLAMADPASGRRAPSAIVVSSARPVDVNGDRVGDGPGAVCVRCDGQAAAVGLIHDGPQRPAPN
jgi:hypothetical protein